MNASLVHFGITKRFLNWINGGSEKIGTKFFKTSTGDASVKINSFKEGINFNGSLGGRGESSLSAFTGSPQSSQSTRVRSKILFVFSFEFLNKMVDQSIVKIFTSQMGISSSGFDFKNTIFNGEDGDIKSTTTQIKNQD
eukprot:Sdes_comp19335_c0_seq2m10513